MKMHFWKYKVTKILDLSSGNLTTFWCVIHIEFVLLKENMEWMQENVKEPVGIKF